MKFIKYGPGGDCVDTNFTGGDVFYGQFCGPNDEMSGTTPNATCSVCPTGYYEYSGICFEEPASADPDKNLGKPEGCGTGNPINTGTGNKYQPETDLPGATPFLSITRHYNSQASQGGPFGSNWRLHGAINVLSATSVIVVRPDQQAINYLLIGSTWTPDADVAHKLVKTASGWKLTTPSNVVETYDASGRLVSVAGLDGSTTTFAYDASGLLTRATDPFGRQLSFTYDPNGRINAITDPASGVITYGYDAVGNLVSVSYPDGRSKTYHYNEPANTSGADLPHTLTGITDENGNRYAMYQYQADGKAIATGRANGADLHTLAYGANSTTVTDPLGTARTHNFTSIFGRIKSVGQSQPGGSGCSAASSSITYDGNGNVASRADFNGNKTCYAYNLTRNLETARVEGIAVGKACPANPAGYTPAANTAERKILTQWHATFRLPVTITEGNRITSIVYDSRGNITSYGVKDNALNKIRTWTTAYTYHASVPGVLVQKVENGPRIDVTDITTTDYYAPDESCTGGHYGCRGQVKQITNALGHVTRYDEYDAHGRVTRMTDPNGVVTTLAYSPRGWLASRTVDTETTSFDYDGVGQLTKLTRPDGSYVSFEYDVAHRLFAIVQQDGSRRTYTLDAKGNRIADTITGSGGTVHYSHSRTFDALGRLWQDIGAYNQTVTYEYDAQGNMKLVDGARTDVADATTHSYDALDRLTQALNADGGIVKIATNALDQTTKVTDPVNQATNYTVNALGDLTQTVSADTGTTARTFDEAGNVKTETDARGIIVTYTWDALNRLTQQQSSDAATPVYQYVYDQCGVGRLCSTLRDSVLDSNYTYDPQGRTASRIDHSSGIGAASGYSYRPGGQVATLIYPGGRSVTTSYDAQGRLSQVATQKTPSDPTVVLAGSFAYGYPFVGASSFQYGNGQTFSLTLDQDYRPQLGADGPHTMQFGRDPAGNITGLVDVNGTLAYAYDATGRLVSAVDSAPDSFGSLGYSYDKNGNRLSETRNAGTMPYTYSPPNWLYQKGSETRTKTANGNTAAISDAATFSYDGYNRLASSQTAAETTTYTYNAQGERIRKVNQNGLSTAFHYGPNGELLFEQDQAGNTREYVWLNGRPLARIDNGTSIYYYHLDHLGTPQAMTDAAGTTVWKADYEPFGKATVRVNTVENNVRLPGQYFDRETNLHYNYFRDYDPTTGRYVQSDPIGLEGGLNIYEYARSNPLTYADPLGLKPVPCPDGLPASAACDDGLDNQNAPQKCATAECAGGVPTSWNPSSPEECSVKCSIEAYLAGAPTEKGTEAAVKAGTSSASTLGLAVRYGVKKIFAVSSILDMAACVKSCKEKFSCQK